MSEEKLEEGHLREALVSEAVRWLGSKASNYRGPNAGQTPEDGFDCSGLVLFVLRRTGIPVPDGIRHTSEFFDRFGISVQEGLQREGDLVFFSRRGLAPKHMGIMITPSYYVHSPGRDGRYVMVSSLNPGPIKAVSGEVLYNRNPIGFKRAAIPQGRWSKVL